MKPFENLELASYLALITGVTLDQISTKRGIVQSNLYEGNHIARTLMEHGLWGYADILIVSLLIGVLYISYRKILDRKNDLVFLLPLISGGIRLLVGVRNFTLI